MPLSSLSSLFILLLCVSVVTAQNCPASCKKGCVGGSSFCCPEHCASTCGADGNCVGYQSFVEPQVAGQCETGFYGSNCVWACPAHCSQAGCTVKGNCIGYEKNVEPAPASHCVNSGPGTGFYSPNCAWACPEKCSQAGCTVKGNCIGYEKNVEPSPATHCVNSGPGTGFYSPNCAWACPDKCSQAGCTVSGNCIGYEKNVEPAPATHCVNSGPGTGFYSPNCAWACPDKCSQAGCTAKGNCVGYDQNKEPGPATHCVNQGPGTGFYAANCAYKCPPRCAQAGCTVNGNCNGYAQYKEPQAAQHCHLSSYGAACQWDCPAHCSTTGMCTVNGNCVGYNHVSATTLALQCQTGFYSNACNWACSDQCKQRGCSNSGDCLCPANCNNGKCDISTGVCSSGCRYPYSGPQCTNNNAALEACKFTVQNQIGSALDAILDQAKAEARACDWVGWKVLKQCEAAYFRRALLDPLLLVYFEEVSAACAALGVGADVGCRFFSDAAKDKVADWMAEKYCEKWAEHHPATGNGSHPILPAVTVSSPAADSPTGTPSYPQFPPQFVTSFSLSSGAPTDKPLLGFMQFDAADQFSLVQYFADDNTTRVATDVRRYCDALGGVKYVSAYDQTGGRANCSFTQGLLCTVPQDYLAYYLATSFNLTQPQPLVFIGTTPRHQLLVQHMHVLEPLLLLTAVASDVAAPPLWRMSEAVTNHWAVSLGDSLQNSTLHYYEDATTRFPLLIQVTTEVDATGDAAAAAAAPTTTTTETVSALAFSSFAVQFATADEFVLPTNCTEFGNNQTAVLLSDR